MSKNFEGEYKEYLNAQAPDLWDRIEAGVDALGSAGQEKVTPITAGKAKKEKKKRRIRYQNYRMLVSVAACLFALILVVPVYFLTRNAGKDASSEAPMMADGAIENVEITNEESAVVTEEAAPAEEAAEPAAEAETEIEVTEDALGELAQANESVVEEQLPDDAPQILDGEDGSTVALPQAQETDSLLETLTTGEEEALPQEDMQVTILGAGEIAEGGMMYAAVRAGEGETETLQLFVSSESGIVFEENKVYRVTVEIAENKNYYTVVEVTAEE